MHPKDHRQRPQLYKVNKMSTDALLQNLTLLLSDESSGESSTVVDFPTQQEMIASVGDDVNFAPI